MLLNADNLVPACSNMVQLSIQLYLSTELWPLIKLLGFHTNEVSTTKLIVHLRQPTVAVARVWKSPVTTKQSKQLHRFCSDIYTCTNWCKYDERLLRVELRLVFVALRSRSSYTCTFPLEVQCTALRVTSDRENVT